MAIDIPALLAEGLAEHKAGRLDEAADRYCRVLDREPDNADALHLLGVAMRARGATDQAIALIRRATRLAPHLVDAWFNLGNALFAAGDPSGAVEAYDAAVALDPRRPETHVSRGVALAAFGDTAAAASAYRAALALDPAHRTARHNLGTALGDLGETEEAAAVLQGVVADFPDLAEAHYNLSHMLLRLGDYTTGFAEYEWRWQTAGFPSRRLHTELPDWDGRPFEGRRLLVHAEQGLGDTLQFCRLAPMAASLGGSVALEVPSTLKRLLGTLSGVDLIAPGDPVPTVSMAVPLMGLPRRLGLTLGSVPARGPYLAAEKDRVARWRSALILDERPIVAINHRGNAASAADRGRSILDPGVLEPLLAIDGLRFILVEKVEADRLEPVWGGGWRLTDPKARFEHPGPDYDAGPDAFLDAAAVITLADHVVTTDTALAHLAGALGRPTELMLKHAPDWRWLETRRTTPWYPSMRLHRQPVAGDWASVVRSVIAALADVGQAVAA